MIGGFLKSIVERVLKSISRNKNQRWSPPKPYRTEVDPVTGYKSEYYQVPSGDDNPDQSQTVRDTSWLEKMIIGKPHEDLPDMPDAQSNLSILRGVENLFNALIQRQLTVQLKQEEKERENNQSAKAKFEKSLDDAVASRATNAKAARDPQLFGDMMAGKHKKDADLSEEELRKRERDRQAIEKRDEIKARWAKTGERLKGFGKALLKGIGFVTGFAGAVKFASVMTDRQVQKMRNLAQYSGELTMAGAQMDANEINRQIGNANALSESAKYVMEAADRRKDATQPTSNMFASGWNYLWGGASDAIATGFEGVNFLLSNIGVDISEWRGESQDDPTKQTPADEQLQAIRHELTEGVLRGRHTRRVGPWNER